MPTGARRIHDGPPKQLQVPTTVDAKVIDASKYVPRRAK
jgi:hypothetical protein